MTLPLLPPRKALAVYEACRADSLARSDEPIVRVEAGRRSGTGRVGIGDGQEGVGFILQTRIQMCNM
jgi:hypothetical protein